MTRFFQILTLSIITLTVNAQEISKKAFTIGEQIEWFSKELNEKRSLNIFLPQDYNSDKKYQVIYLLDGSSHEDFLHICGLVQFFDLQFQTPETIVVGITNVDRKRDFTFPTTDKELQNEFPTTGGSERFIAYLEKEVQPYINTNYPTNGTNIIIGQSLGGLLATEILLKKPELFTHFLITSPSLWWDNQSLLKDAKTLLSQHDYHNTFIYLAVGEQEHKVMVKDAQTLEKLLTERKDLKIHFVLFPEENHATILHNSIYKAFLLQYPLKN